ncbi:C4-dicarboxylate ABC transporter permease [Comamonadaceae bacterium]|nr:C4-dicarboxylate ABC transporter permease [Comamonadaceae bacterium]
MLIALFVLLLALITIGVPILLVMGIVGLSGILIEPGLVPALFPQKMFAMLDNFSLLALPYFILAGELVSAGGISKRLVEFAEAVVGHWRGGLAHASVVSSMVFAGVSGSSVADTSAIGSILVPAMKDRGYKPGFAAALVACAGTIGAIIPPSMTMIVYGSMANVSIGGLFLGGIVPGILIGVGLMIVIYIYSLSENFPELRRTTGKFVLRKVIHATISVWPALLAPVLVVGGILTGAFTATEAGVVACFYGFFIGFFVYRILKLRDLPKIFIRAAVTTAMVSGIIGVAGAFGWLLAYLNFNDIVLNAITHITGSKTGVMLLLMGIMLLLTMFVDSMAILIIMIPVAVVIGRNFGIDEFQLGLMMVMATQIGSTTPPVAVLLFVATSIAGCSYSETVRYCWAFIIAEISVLLLVVFWADLAAWIPHYYLG